MKNLQEVIVNRFNAMSSLEKKAECLLTIEKVLWATENSNPETEKLMMAQWEILGDMKNAEEVTSIEYVTNELHKLKSIEEKGNYLNFVENTLIENNPEMGRFVMAQWEALVDMADVENFKMTGRI